MNIIKVQLRGGTHSYIKLASDGAYALVLDPADATRMSYVDTWCVLNLFRAEPNFSGFVLTIEDMPT